MSIPLTMLYYTICGRTGRSVDATRNSTESGRSRVRSQAAAGAKYGESSSREKSHGFSPEKRRSKFDDAKSRPSISSGFSQHSFLADPCQINPVLLLLYHIESLFYILSFLSSRRWTHSQTLLSRFFSKQ